MESERRNFPIAVAEGTPPEHRTRLPGNRLGVLCHPDRSVGGELGIFFERLINTLSNLRSHANLAFIKEFKALPTIPTFDELYRELRNLFPGDEDLNHPEYLEALHDFRRGFQEDYENKHPEHKTHEEEFYAFSDLVGELLTVFQRPGENNTNNSSSEPKKRKRNGEYSIRSRVVFYVPHSGRMHGREVASAGYRFEAPADIYFGLRENKTGREIVFIFFPVAYSMISRHEELDGVPPDESKDILHGRSRDLNQAAKIDELVNQAKETYRPRSLRIELRNPDGSVVSAIDGEVEEQDRVIGFNLRSPVSYLSESVFVPIPRIRTVSQNGHLPPLERFVKGVVGLELKSQ